MTEKTEIDEHLVPMYDNSGGRWAIRFDESDADACDIYSWSDDQLIPCKITHNEAKCIVIEFVSPYGSPTHKQQWRLMYNLEDCECLEDGARVSSEMICVTHHRPLSIGCTQCLGQDDWRIVSVIA